MKINKKDMVENQNYHIFFITQKQHATRNQIIENIDSEINRIKDEMLSIINE